MSKASKSSAYPFSNNCCEPDCSISSPTVAMNLIVPCVNLPLSLISIRAMAKAANPDFISAAPLPYKYP